VEKSLTNFVCYNLQVDNIGTNEARQNEENLASQCKHDTILMRKFEYTADSVVGLPLKSNISHHDLKAQFEFDEDFFTTWMSWPFVMALLAKTALMGLCLCGSS